VALKIVLVIRPDEINTPDEERAMSRIHDETRSQRDTFLSFRTWGHTLHEARTLEHAALFKKFPDAVKFSMPNDPSVRMLVKLARQKGYLPQLPKRRTKKKATFVDDGIDWPSQFE